MVVSRPLKYPPVVLVSKTVGGRFDTRQPFHNLICGRLPPEDEPRLKANCDILSLPPRSSSVSTLSRRPQQKVGAMGNTSACASAGNLLATQ
eukprot:2017381-Pyramimonas_sp.AAC.1